MPQEQSPPVSPAVAAVIEGLTPTELARLVAYRSAVRAGFYTDWPDGLPERTAAKQAAASS
jgi:hypothetical protein